MPLRLRGARPVIFGCLLSAACSRPSESGVPHDSSDSGHDTQDSTPWNGDTAIEHVPPVDSVPGQPMCSLTLDCGQTIPDEPKIDCVLRVVDGWGRTDWEGPAGVELHGRSSISFPKPQYSVELRDEAGEPVDADLLGMGGESDWILNGAWVDRALFRSKLAYDLFQAFEPSDYAPESEYCTLTLDGNWVGIYLLTERVKRDRSRIAIEADVDATGESFVLKLDDGGGIAANTLGYGTWKLVYPTNDEATLAQVAGIQGYLAGWESAVVSADPGDPKTGVATWIDVDSFIDFVLLEEAVKNNDAYFLSVYIWKDRGGLLHFTPWDMDLTLGQPSYNKNELSSEWILYRPPFISTVAVIPEVRERLAARWRELRAGVLATDAVLARIDGYEAVMGDAIDSNFDVWPIEEVDFGGYLYPVSSYEEELEKVTTWIPERLTWVDDHIDTY
jgi:hypothetical protein